MKASLTGQACVGTSTLVGTQAVPVEVQIDVACGLPAFTIVGLGDAAVLEARERVRAAIRASGYTFPNARVVVNLAPGPLRKHGTGFDLPIALALLVATGQIPAELMEQHRAVGEVALDGSVRCVPGMLAHGLASVADGHALFGPCQAADALRTLGGLRYRPLESLRSILGDRTEKAPQNRHKPAFPEPDLSDVAGHTLAKRALEIAAAGGHNLLLSGPPGSGKTMLARRLPGILPPLDDEERVESAVVHSVAGLDELPILSGSRPFRAPHHSASIAGLVGGGAPPRPGEVSLAHNGVLFLDELPEFGPSSLQTLRQPMEDGRIVLVRAEGRVSFPARFSLVGAANPCPCGYLGDPVRHCTCTHAVVTRYRNRVGGPLMDRIDLALDVERIEPELIVRMATGEDSSSVAARVRQALEVASAQGRSRNAVLSGAALIDACRMSPGVADVVSMLARSCHLSGRGVTRLLRVARTIADLDQASAVQKHHVIEAVSYRKQES